MNLLLAMRGDIFIQAFSDFIMLRMASKIIGVCHSEQEAGKLYEQMKPDILLIDVRFGASFSYDLIKEILRKDSSAKIIGVSAYYLLSIEETLRRVGAKGYMIRNDATETMQEIICKVYSGGSAFCSNNHL